MTTAITIHESSRDIRIPLYPTDNRFHRVAGDVCLGGFPSCNAPLRVEFILHPDGTLTHWNSEWKLGSGVGHGRLSFARGDDEPQPKFGPTPEQTKTVAGVWLDRDRHATFGLSPNDRVCNWAFGQMTPEEVSAKYGAGEPVYLNGSGGEVESPEPTDRTPYHKGD